MGDRMNMNNDNIISRGLAWSLAGAIALSALFFMLQPSFRIGTPARAQFETQAGWAGTSSGSANAYAVTLANYDAYRTGVKIYFSANFVNSGLVNGGASTLNVSGLGTKNIYKFSSAGLIALQGGEIGLGYTEVNFDGTEFVLLTSQSSALPGMIFDYSGPVPPTGFLVAGGQAVSRSTYFNLFNATVIQQSGTLSSGSEVVTGLTSTANLNVGFPVSGTDINSGTTVSSIDSGTQIHISANALGNGTFTLTFAPNGVGDGSTTFNVIDLRGEAAHGKDDMGGTAANRLTTAGASCNGVQVGVSCGAQNRTIAQANFPNVNFTVTGSSFVQVGTVNGGSICCSGTPGTITVNSGGSGTALPTIEPLGVVYKIVKY